MDRGRSGPLDSHSRPVRIYHGTRDDINALEVEHRDSKSQRWLDRGGYVTDSPGFADSCASLKVGDGEPKSGAGQMDGRDVIRPILQALLQLPLILWAQMAGKSIRSFLSDLTGLSPARIAQGNLDNIRASTAARVTVTASARGRNLAMKKGWSADEFNQFIDDAPRMQSGEAGMWANWVYALQYPEALLLPLTISHALKTDELIRTLTTTFNTQNPTAFVQAILDMVDGEFETQIVRSDEESASEESRRSAWLAADSWDAVSLLLPNIAENLLLEHFAALDAEWGSRYFQAMKPEPIFLWLAPRLNDQLDLTSGEKKFRNLIYRPVRRLLELSHALAHRHYRKRWPAAPAGRGELGEALGLSDADVGNYLDGTRGLTMRAYQTYWHVLCRHFDRHKSKPDDFPMCPSPLGFIAIAWQHLLIQTTDKHRFKSAVLLDKEDYRRRWKDHRRRWVDQLPSGDVSWPDWVLNQSV